MATEQQQVVSPVLFRWIVGGLLLALVALVGLLNLNLISELNSIRQTTEAMAIELTRTRKDLTDVTAGVRVEAATTNSKLDGMIAELRQPKGQH